jgi:hypothetical protein
MTRTPIERSLSFIQTLYEDSTPLSSYNFEAEEGHVLLFSARALTSPYSPSDKTHAALFYHQYPSYPFALHILKSQHDAFQTLEHAKTLLNRKRLYKDIKENTIFVNKDNYANPKFVILEKIVGGRVFQGYHMETHCIEKNAYPGEVKKNQKNRFQEPILEDIKGHFSKIKCPVTSLSRIYRPWTGKYIQML